MNINYYKITIFQKCNSDLIWFPSSIGIKTLQILSDNLSLVISMNPPLLQGK